MYSPVETAERDLQDGEDDDEPRQELDIRPELCPPPEVQRSLREQPLRLREQRVRLFPRVRWNGIVDADPKKDELRYYEQQRLYEQG